MVVAMGINATLMLVAYRHGLRATEICDLEWSQVEWGRNAALQNAPRQRERCRSLCHSAQGATKPVIPVIIVSIHMPAE